MSCKREEKKDIPGDDTTPVMSYIQRNNTHTYTQTRRKKVTPPPKNLFDARVTGFIPSPSTVRFWFLRPSRPAGNVFTWRKSHSRRAIYTHVHHIQRASMDTCRTVEMDTASREQNNVVKKISFNSLVVVRHQRLGGRETHTVSKSRRMICVWKLQLPGTNQKRENSIFSPVLSTCSFYFSLQMTIKNLGAL